MALIDPRVVKMAEVLVNTSLKVKKGESILISADFTAKPLVLELYRLLIKKGAKLVRVSWESYELGEIYFKNASQAQIHSFPELSFNEIKKMDCWIGIRSSANTKGLVDIDPRLISTRSKVLKKIVDWRVEKTRWVITDFPCEALAQEAEMSLGDYEDFVFSAVNGVDWKKVYKKQEKIRSLLNKTKKVRIVAKDTDLSLDISGRHAVNAAGEFNMPDGEVFTSVVENTACGFITYTYPAIYMGREFRGVRLEFKGGKVVRAMAEKNEEALNKILDMDHGARFLGELGIGNNYKITRFTKDILFDEKMGGSIHLALGKGYKETLSKNTSALHWDMIKDLKSGGELWFDKKLVQKNGKWLIQL
jgi:aminopeptidase